MRCLSRTALVAFLTIAGCDNGAAQEEAGNHEQVCTVVAAMRPIATEIRETSGLARGRANPDIFWTHNDSGNQPLLFAIAADGTIRTRVPLSDARLTDWEDIEGGTCGIRNCLYLADIGDNAGARKNIAIYEVLEPALTDRHAKVVRTIAASYPDGAQDAEALFRLPDGGLYVVTKGRQQAIKLYQLSSAGTNGVGTLRLIRELAPQPTAETERVTAASASPDGKWVAIRSYSTLFLYRTRDLLGGGKPAITHSLLPLAEKQGESISLANDGTIWLTSEAEREEDAPTIVSLRCALPG